MTSKTLDAAAHLLRQLHDAGYEVSRREPDRIRYRYVGPGDAPQEAVMLLEALRQHKTAALELLTSSDADSSPQGDRRPWNEDWERARLESTYTWCDEEAARTGSWVDAWEWTRRYRPDLVEAVDAAFDAIDAAFGARDVTGNIEACRRLREAIQGAADVYHKRETPD